MCTACVGIERAWQQLTCARPPNMRLAFYRGYIVGADDERAGDLGGNPYRDGATARFWRYGKELGERAAS